MEADRGFIEDVEHVHQVGTERGSHRNPLRFASAESAQRAVEREVAEAHFRQVTQPALDFFRYAAECNRHRARLRGDPLPRGGDLLVAQLGQILPADAHRQGRGAQSIPVATGAGAIAPPPAEKHPQVHFVLAAFEPREEPVEPTEVSLGNALDHFAPLLGRQFRERHIDANVFRLGECEQLDQFVRISGRVPRRDGAAA